MATFLPLLLHGVYYGLILIVPIIVVMIGSLLWNPAIWAGDYPPDVKARFGPPDARTLKQRRIVALPFFGLMFGSYAWAIAALPAAGLSINFLNAFIVVLVMGVVFNLVDLVIIDWLFFVTWRPRLIVLPGTEGMAGYRDYAFHFRAFLKGLAYSPIVALVIAAIAAGVEAIG